MKVGLDRLPDIAHLVSRLKSSRVAVLAHPASVDRALCHIGDVLDSIGVGPTIFFGPEHGYGGEAQDMIGVADAADARTGAPIVSLYGDRFEDLSPKPEHLALANVLLVDLADVGARYYTFVWTSLLAARAAAKAGVHTIVLDRPNPIGGRPADLEGRPQSPGFLSFVGLEPIPVRHSLTIGEIVTFFAERDGLGLGPDGAVSVVHVERWDRAATAHAWERPFVMPSPNMPTADTALVYPGGCLLEATNLSEGRGTTRPFELLGAPWIAAEKFVDSMNALRLPGVHFRPAVFEPTFQKFAKQTCAGCQVHVLDRQAFRPVLTGVALIDSFRRSDRARFAWRQPPYEYEHDKMPFDILSGSDELRRQIEAEAPLAEIAESWREDERMFQRQRARFLLY
jgi:uncharacterized protein YbbC (DUF1343 family)